MRNIAWAFAVVMTIFCRETIDHKLYGGKPRGGIWTCVRRRWHPGDHDYPIYWFEELFEAHDRGGVDTDP